MQVYHKNNVFCTPWCKDLKCVQQFLGAELMKLLTYIFSFAYFLTSTCVLAEKAGESSIAAVVNDKSILTSDLNHRVNLLVKSSQSKATAAMVSDLRKDLLKQMIDEALQRQQLDKYEIKVEGPEMDMAWGIMEQRLGIAKGQMDSFLKANGIPVKVVKDQLTASIGWQHYINGRYGKDVQVTDAEVKAELDRLEKNKQSNQALLSEIVFTYKTPEEAAEAKRKADDVSSKLRSGALFPAMAQQYSDSASAARGGDIGWVSLDDMTPEVKRVVESTRRGEVSAPIPVAGGYRILGVRDRHGVGSLGESVEYVSFQQIEFKYPMFGGEEGAQETHIKANTVRQNARSCSMMKKMTDGRPRVKMQSIERVQTAAMNPELAKLLNKMKPGDRSELMNTGDGLIMFMMCDKNVVKPHEPDEKEIKNILREKKLNALYEKELRALRRTAFIDMKS